MPKSSTDNYSYIEFPQENHFVILVDKGQTAPELSSEAVEELRIARENPSNA